MKRLITVFGVCVCMLAPAAAFGQTHTWTGQAPASATWLDANNWSGGANWPGHSSVGDTALIADATLRAQVDVDGSVSSTVASVTVDANTAGTSMTLKIASGGSITFDAVVLTGDSANTYVAIFDIDVAPTITDDVDAKGDVDFDSAVSFDIGTGANNDMRIGDGAVTTNFDKKGAGTVTVKGKIIIKGGNAAGENAIVTVSAGTLQTG